MATPIQKPAPKVNIDFQSFSHIIVGKPYKSRNSFHGINPATKKRLWEVPLADGQDVERAVRAANAAQRRWAQKSWKERQQVCLRLKDVYSNYVDELTELLILETGKPSNWARSEVGSCGFNADYHAKLSLPNGESFDNKERQVMTEYTPLGVVAAILPWNSPLTMCFGKLFPALVAGNAVIIKPSPFTPYSTMKAVEIAQQVFAPGLVQVLAGDASLGASLVEHPDIHKIAFTGSMPTGKKIMRAAAATLKRITLELGGNDPCIVLPDVDIADVAPKVVMGCFYNTGQVCVATKRIYVHESIYRSFLDAMIAFTSQLKVGEPGGKGFQIKGSTREFSTLGPIQNKMQFEKVKGLFENSKRNGYRFATGQDTVEESVGYYIKPAIIDNPPDDARVVTEEAFGPIVPCQSWRDETEVIARANNTKAGLAATLWGKDLKQCEKIALQMEAGSVFINSFAQPTPWAPFGGMKESGIGSEWGRSGILAYMNQKVIHRFK